MNDSHITKEMIDEDETIRWTLTTPLYNIGEHTYNLSEEFRTNHPEIHGQRYRDLDIDWFMIMKIQTGVLFRILYLIYFLSLASNLNY